MKKRILAFLLCFAMVMPILPVRAVTNELIVSDTKVTLPTYEKQTITATPAADVQVSAYQWQIKIPNTDTWVNISGADDATLNLTYAMVASLVDDGIATIRCKANNNGEELITDEVTVSIDYDAVPEFPEAETPAPVVLSEAQVVGKAVITPPAKTKAPAESNPSAQETQAPAVTTSVDVENAEAKLAEANAALEAAEAELSDAETAAATAAADAETAAAESEAAAEAAAVEDASEELIAAAQAAAETAAAAKTTADNAAAAVEAAQAKVAEAETAVSDAEAALEAAKASAVAAPVAADAPGAFDNFLPMARGLNGNSGIALAAEDGENDGGSALVDYSVVINYIFEDNTTAAPSYTATLAAGSDFSATVTHPTVQGYLPYISGETEASTSIELNITKIQAGLTYTVTYKPTNVNYTVIHYKQSMDNDNYTIDERETKQGLTGSTVPEVAKNYEGFYALLYEKPAIAADGSTVVEVYYDRYYYLMNFDLDGGYGVEPIYARYGSPISVTAPTKIGYSFDGWSPVVPATMPVGGGTYNASWTVNDTAKVTVVFWGENADDEGYSYIKSSEVNVKPGTEFTYSEDGSMICALEVHTHSAACGYSCGQSEHVHTSGCYSCGSEEHTHVRGCYTATGGTLSDNAETNTTWLGRLNDTQPNGGVYTVSAVFTTRYYVKIGDSFYQVTFGRYQSINNFSYSVSCSSSEHTHDDTCGIICGQTVHAHSDACGYACGKAAHTHNADCYLGGAGLDASLWNFVNSDTVTVAADGSSVVNVYYDRTEFTLHFRATRSNTDNYGTITDKWGADIKDRFFDICDSATDSGTYSWSERSDGDGPWTSYIGVMPSEDRIYYAYSANGTMTAYYYFENLDGNYTDEDRISVTAEGSGYSVTDEDRAEFEGFTHDRSNSTYNGSPFNNARFYYTRNSYNLVFNNGVEDVKTESVKYEAPLGSYAFTPAAPNIYAPGSVTFAGWYQNPECSGAEYKLSEHTMPASNLILYAKWVPVIHTVSFYLTQDAMNAGNKIGTTHPDQLISHGSNVETVPADPVNGSYTFIGWFYMDGNTEKAFDFDNMPITKDMKVYGKWSSNVLKEYFVYYKIQGTDTQIADPITSSALAGSTKTFDAKGGTDLYADYQEGYFPVTKSHSMTIDIAENAGNTFTFWYVKKEAVPYTVYYVTDSQNEGGTLGTIELGGKTYYVLAETKTVEDNRKAVVTENFVPVSGYLPDAYQKRLVVDGSEDAVNEIIFYYTADTQHAYYKITHYTQNLDGTTWTEYASSQIVGDIGTTYNATPITIDGFTYNSEVDGTVAKGELTANGLELKLYYTRNSYPYVVRYLEQGTDKELQVPKADTEKFDKVISEKAIDIAGYTPVDPTAQTLTIKIEESANEPRLNIITFYYTEQEATISYVAVGPENATNFGSVDPASETVKISTVTATGSTPTADENFKFVGWYEDEACTDPVDTEDGTVDATTGKFVPTKPVAGWSDETTYYAKFEYNLTTFTITKTAANGTYENDDRFVFDVKGPDGVSFSVTLAAGQTVTVKDVTVGATYTVTERTAWSWRYTASDGTIISKEIKADPNENKFEFTNTLATNKWLSGSGITPNVFD